MTRERWQRIADIFHAAQDRQGDERVAFVRQAAASSELRREVESLLAADQEPMVLDHPIGATAHAVLVDNAAVDPGTFLGHYRIDSLLGSGGMGEVYRARDTKLNRDVAIKILPPAFASDPERLARFKREAQALASLNHPNIGGIYGFEDATGSHALILELVDGPTLADQIARGPLPLNEVLAIARQIADALEAAHEQGIIHRDLKPANIKVREDGTVKVLDFGLAKAIEAQATGLKAQDNATASPTITTPAMTAAGLILGTAAYMSPEQAKGKPADKRSDIWAFGVVLYEMLTGERPFKGDDVADTLASVLRAEPDWSRLPIDTPPAVLRLLRRALAKPREQRTGDVTSVKLDLDDSRAPLSQSIVPVPGRSSQRLPWLVAGVVVALAVAAYLWLPRRPVAPPLQPLVRLDADLDVELTTTGFASVVLSPDGRRMAYVSRGRLFTRALDQADAVELTGVSGASSPFFSPDGRWLAYYSGNSLRKVSVDGGAPIPIAPTTAIFVGGFWAEHGFLVTPLGTLTPLSRITEGAAPTPLTTLADGERSHRWPHMLPGDTAVLFTTLQSESIDNANIDLLALGSGVRQTIQRGGSFPRFVPASDHNGFITYLSRGALFALPFDSASMRVLGPSVRILDRIAYTAETGSAAFDVARNGTAVLREVSQQPEPTMQWLNATSQLQPVTETPGRWPAFSPDGKQLAMMVNGELRVVDLATGNSRVVATRETVAGNIGGVVWSRDGRFVLFGNGTYGTRYVSADGGSRVTVLIRDGSAPSDFSPDGTKLLVRRFQQRGGNSDLVLASITNSDTGPTVSGMEDYVATGSSEYAGTFSPDGRWIAYMSSESSIYEVYVRAVPDTGARYRVSLASGNFPAWSRTAPEIYFQASDGQIMVSRYAVRSGAFIPEPPKAWGGKRLEGLTTNRLFDLSPDGARVVGSFTAAGEGARPNGRVTFLLNFTDELRRRIPLP